MLLLSKNVLHESTAENSTIKSSWLSYYNNVSYKNGYENADCFMLSLCRNTEMTFPNEWYYDGYQTNEFFYTM